MGIEFDPDEGIGIEESSQNEKSRDAEQLDRELNTQRGKLRMQYIMLLTIILIAAAGGAAWYFSRKKADNEVTQKRKITPRPLSLGTQNFQTMRKTISNMSEKLEKLAKFTKKTLELLKQYEHDQDMQETSFSEIKDFLPIEKIRKKVSKKDENETGLSNSLRTTITNSDQASDINSSGVILELNLELVKKFLGDPERKDIKSLYSAYQKMHGLTEGQKQSIMMLIHYLIKAKISIRELQAIVQSSTPEKREKLPMPVINFHPKEVKNETIKGQAMITAHTAGKVVSYNVIYSVRIAGRTGISEVGNKIITLPTKTGQHPINLEASTVGRDPRTQGLAIEHSAAYSSKKNLKEAMIAARLRKRKIHMRRFFYPLNTGVSK